MFNQTLKNICSFFNPGKKSIFSGSGRQEVTIQKNNNTGKSDIRLLYHRDISNLQTAESKPEAMQHDWWIN